MPKNLSIAFNIIWFQACWFACVLIGNKAALVILPLILIVYLFIERLRIEWPILLGVVMLGLIVDMSLIRTGVLTSNTALSLPPLWLSVLWLGFATTLNHSLKPLLNKRVLFLLLAAVGGPVCYKLGVELTDIQFGYQQPVALAIIAVVWLFAGLVIHKLYERWKYHVLN